MPHFQRQLHEEIRHHQGAGTAAQDNDTQGQVQVESAPADAGGLPPEFSGAFSIAERRRALKALPGFQGA